MTILILALFGIAALYTGLVAATFAALSEAYYLHIRCCYPIDANSSLDATYYLGMTVVGAPILALSTILAGPLTYLALALPGRLPRRRAAAPPSDPGV